MNRRELMAFLGAAPLALAAAFRVKSKPETAPLPASPEYPGKARLWVRNLRSVGGWDLIAVTTLVSIPDGQGHYRYTYDFGDQMPDLWPEGDYAVEVLPPWSHNLLPSESGAAPEPQ